MDLIFEWSSFLVSVALFAFENQITDSLKNNHDRKKFVPHVRLIIAFVSFGLLIGSLPQLLVSSHQSMYLFFLPFGLMTYFFIKRSVNDLKKIKTRAEKRLYQITLTQYCSILGTVAILVLVVAPFANLR